MAHYLETFMLKKVGTSVAALALVLGCASSQSTIPPTPSAAPASSGPAVKSIVGEYGLVGIDGHALPFSPRGRTSTGSALGWAVVASTLAVESNGLFHIETSYHTNADGDQSSSKNSGVCYDEEGQFRMVWADGGLTAMMRRGDTLVVNVDGASFSYLRR